MIDFKWEIEPNSSTIAPSEDGMIKVIKSVTVNRVGFTKDGFSDFLPLTVSFSSPNPASYTPWESVTLDLITEWIVDTVPAKTIEMIDSSIISNINNDILRNEIKNYPLPWQ